MVAGTGTTTKKKPKTATTAKGTAAKKKKGATPSNKTSTDATPKQGTQMRLVKEHRESVAAVAGEYHSLFQSYSQRNKTSTMGPTKE